MYRGLYMVPLIGIIGYIIGLDGDNGKENRNYHIITGYILGLYGDNGQEAGNYLHYDRVYLGVIHSLSWTNPAVNPYRHP